MIRLRWAGALVVLACAGCRPGGQAFMPLDEGNRWSYSVRAGFLTKVEDIEVRRRLSVADGSGWELGGTMGVSRLAWKDGILVAEDLPSTRFSPALPLLVGGQVEAKRQWSGIMRTLAGAKEAEAQLEQESEKITIGGRTYTTRRAKVTIVGLGAPIELTTWFAEGMGIVRQEQRIGDQLVRSMEYLAGP